ncbi:hypothetical protein MUO32_26370 [Shinella sp. CPCC 101442]|uniref:hypothetical protein n=1 Tax=Shinella sp. CPCC 101442 TaxID=2932265 RepID=UPI00215359F8|nr:hypothetical protein [Shinella sp. CPCC 101442]MCR6502557.1 hypothetical protein [Shinella sp. CPCC 101442]
MSTETHTIHEEEIQRALLLVVELRQMQGTTGREKAIFLSKAINDAVMAERENKTQTTRKKIIEALVDFPHSIDDSKVEIRFDPRRTGHNALNQFLSVLEGQFTAAPKAEG